MTEKIALQLWSVQEACKENFYQTLKAVKTFGYQGVEFAGYHGVSAKQLRGWLDELGLEVAASHIPYEALHEDLEAVIAFEKILGNQRVVCPYANFSTYSQWLAFMEELAGIAARLKEDGMTLYYHNHDHEWRSLPDTDILVEMLNQTEEVQLEVDLYWLNEAGLVVSDWLTAQKNRIGLVHIKDRLAEKAESTEVGSGILPIHDYVRFAKEQKLPWLIIEQEAFQAYPPLEAAKISYQQLAKIVEEVS